MLTRVPLRTVIFDWDGTLLDSYRADANAYVKMFRALKIPWNLADLKRQYSPDWHRVYRAAGIPEDRWAEADKLWRQFYRSERPRLQPRARWALEQLGRRYRLGLVTSGSGWRVLMQLRTFGVDRLFAVQVFGEQAPRRKPHPVALQTALRRLGDQPAACIYVGDAPEDMEMARRAGVFSIGILGHSPVPQRLRDSRPNALIGGIAALPGLLT